MAEERINRITTTLPHKIGVININRKYSQKSKLSTYTTHNRGSVIVYRVNNALGYKKCLYLLKKT